MKIESMKIRDIMSENPAVVDVSVTVSDAIALMRRRKVRELPVLDGDKVVGLVSYTSFVERRSVPLTAKVDSIMLPCPRLDEDSDLIDAAESLVSSGIRGAPVIRAGKMIGFVSRTDLIRAMRDVDDIGEKSVAEFMTRNPESIGPDDTVRKAQNLMRGINEKALPVVDGGNRVVGVIGMSEILKTLWSPKANQPAR
jgi:CBS domain-containing protein